MPGHFILEKAAEEPRIAWRGPAATAGTDGGATEIPGLSLWVVRASVVKSEAMAKLPTGFQHDSVTMIL